METKQCLECDKDFFGRADKKFCSDSCRNAFNNKNKSDDEAVMKRINRSLRNNRKILNELNPEDKTRLTKEKLIKKGFDFDYITQTYVTKEGKEYRFCYDQGYLDLGDSSFLLVKKKLSE